MKLKDRRTDSQKETHNLLVVARDQFMSGWGEAQHGTSYAAWACDSLAMRDRVLLWVQSRGDMSNVRCKRGLPTVGHHDHLSVYVVTGWDVDRPVTHALKHGGGNDNPEEDDAL